MSDAYARSFARLCGGTISTLLADTHGPRHLDVGCGLGELAEAAAAEGREVLAVDADPEMVAATAARGVPSRLSVLPDTGLPSGGFDAVTANFVLNHVPDPWAAARELARVCAPGGRVAITTWTSRPTAQARLFSESLEAAGASPVRGTRLAAHLDFERSPDGIAALVGAAGLEPIIVRELEWEWEIAWEDLWAGIAGGVATIGLTYRAQAPDLQARIECEMRARAEKLTRGGVVVLPSVAAYVVAAPAD